MTPQEYAATKFGDVVSFDLVKQNQQGFAKVFSQNSVALEALLLNVWSKGIKTFACGNDHVLIPTKKDFLEYERDAQFKYELYANARGINKLLKVLFKQKYVAVHHAYISFDPSTIPAPEEFEKNVIKTFKPLQKQCGFHIGRPKINASGDRETLGLYFNISREKELKNRNLNNMSDDEIIKTSKPPADLFDHYFDIVNDLVDEHFKKYHSMANITSTREAFIVSNGSTSLEKSFDKNSAVCANNKSRLDHLIADATAISLKQQPKPRNLFLEQHSREER